MHSASEGYAISFRAWRYIENLHVQRYVKKCPPNLKISWCPSPSSSDWSLIYDDLLCCGENC
jgi:hypothetical protein